MLSPTYEITTALSHTDELISPPYDIAIVTISYRRVTMSSVWDSMMSKKNMGWPFYAAAQNNFCSAFKCCLVTFASDQIYFAEYHHWWCGDTIGRLSLISGRQLSTKHVANVSEKLLPTIYTYKSYRGTTYLLHIYSLTQSDTSFYLHYTHGKRHYLCMFYAVIYITSAFSQNGDTMSWNTAPLCGKPVSVVFLVFQNWVMLKW